MAAKKRRVRGAKNVCRTAKGKFTSCGGGKKRSRKRKSRK